MKSMNIHPDNWRVVADYGDQCGEGPLWDPRTRTLYWIDIAGRRVSRHDWMTAQSSIVTETLDIAGIGLHESGGFVMVNSQGIWLWDGSNPPAAVAQNLDGVPLAMNDCIVDPLGRLLSGSCYFDTERADYRLGKLIRVETDGTLAVLDEGFHLANGLAFSPDCRTLYFADSAQRKIFAYDYRGENGTVGDRRTFVEIPTDEGIPDGITVDADGFVWCARWFGAGISRFDPDGRLQVKVALPAKQTSALAFGGPDLGTVFVTSAGLSDALPLAPPDYDAARGNIGGQLFAAELGISGKEEFRCRIALPVS
jgi:sugar lactone lactonase YvrE